MTSTPSGGAGTLQAEDRYRLSRHVSIRPVPEGFLVESILSGRSFRLTSPSVFHVLLALTRPVRIGDLLEATGEAQRPGLLAFLEQCRELQILTVVNDDGLAEEDRSSLAHWEFHDLLFHVRSRSGRNRWPLGTTYHLRGVLPPEPVFKNGPSPGIIPLVEPDIERLKREDLPLTRVLEERRTRYRGAPLDLACLGEFLYRTCRVTGVIEAGGEHLAHRVYPSGGSLHALEVYVVASRCQGLVPGVYHYRAGQHGLAPVSDVNDEVRELLREVRARTGDQLSQDPPVLLVLTARFRRVMWKYQSIAYRCILAEVGALYQTMYLVATAMGLAPCAIGAGDSDRFARVAGTDYYGETSVGEFVLAGRLD
ncbi:MAG TPA: SagB family peptide dehydrogenase [Longimicrobiaceae bacterium]|nr:SagB family peptide dehydrogenase [Longimicrobiaceae bacterium]